MKHETLVALFAALSALLSPFVAYLIAEWRRRKREGKQALKGQQQLDREVVLKGMDLDARVFERMETRIANLEMRADSLNEERLRLERENASLKEQLKSSDDETTARIAQVRQLHAENSELHKRIKWQGARDEG